MNIINSFFILLFFNQLLLAQEIPPIQLDRPDQTECPYTVPTKHFQFECGFNFEKIKDVETNIVTPTILSKYGINDKFELRIITELATNRIDPKSITGINPVEFGFKSRLVNGRDNIPDISFLAHLSVPYLSSKAFTTTYFAPSFRFLIQHIINNRFSLSYNLGSEWDGETATPNFIYTLAGGFSINESIGIYGEFYGFLPQFEIASHKFDGGFTYLVKNNIMMDLSGGFGLSNNEKSSFISLGFSIRLPR